MPFLFFIFEAVAAEAEAVVATATAVRYKSSTKEYYATYIIILVEVNFDFRFSVLSFFGVCALTKGSNLHGNLKWAV